MSFLKRTCSPSKTGIKCGNCFHKNGGSFAVKCGWGIITTIHISTEMIISTIVFPAFKTTDRISTLYPCPPDTFENLFDGKSTSKFKTREFWCILLSMWSCEVHISWQFCFVLQISVLRQEFESNVILIWK